MFGTLNSPQYLFYNNTSTLGLYNTSNSTSPWQIDVNGIGTFSTVNSPIGNIGTANVATGNVATANITNETVTNSTISNATITNLSVIKQNVQPIFITATSYSVSDTTPTMTYLSGLNNVTITFNALSSANNYNIYEFRKIPPELLFSQLITFTTGANCIMIDLANATQTTIESGNKKYFKFQYVNRNGTNNYYLLA